MKSTSVRPDLVIVGSVALDSITTPYGSVEEEIGGSAVYASLSASFLCNTGIVGIVGKDFPEEARLLLKQAGIDLSGLVTANGETFRWRGEYSADMNSRKTLETRLNVFADFSPEIPTRYRTSSYLFLGNIDPRLQLRVLEQSPKCKFVAADTMDLWIQTAADNLHEVINAVDLITMTDHEACLFTKKSVIADAANSLISSHGVKYVLIKKGEHGSILFANDYIRIIPAFPLAKTRDPTGAGDVFAGGLLGYLAHEDKDPNLESITAAIVLGTIMASFCVEDFGIKALAATRIEQIARRLDAYQHFVSLYPPHLALS